MTRRNRRSPLRPAAAMLAVVVLVSGCGGSQASPGSTPAAAADASSVPASTLVGADPALVPKGETVTGVAVDRVVDGDTIRVHIAGEDTSVRLIGINTPETVKPGSPIECFGPESSDFAKSVLTGQSVTLEFDDSQGETDRYGRVLAYVWLELADGGLSLFNLAAVAGGYAEERQYGSRPYAWADEFARAQDQAQAAAAGLWGACR